MTFKSCPRCGGMGTWFGSDDCTECKGACQVEVGRVEYWLDAARSLITLDGKYLCGNCVQPVGKDVEVTKTHRQPSFWDYLYNEWWMPNGRP